MPNDDPLLTGVTHNSTQNHVMEMTRHGEDGVLVLLRIASHIDGAPENVTVPVAYYDDLKDCFEGAYICDVDLIQDLQKDCIEVPHCVNKCVMRASTKNNCPFMDRHHRSVPCYPLLLDPMVWKPHSKEEHLIQMKKIHDLISSHLGIMAFINASPYDESQQDCIEEFSILHDRTNMSRVTFGDSVIFPPATDVCIDNDVMSICKSLWGVSSYEVYSPVNICLYEKSKYIKTLFGKDEREQYCTTAIYNLGFPPPASLDDSMVISRLMAVSCAVERVKKTKGRTKQNSGTKLHASFVGNSDKDLPEMFVDNISRFIKATTFNPKTIWYLKSLREKMDGNFDIVSLGTPWQDLLKLFKQHVPGKFFIQKRLDDYKDFWLWDNSEDEDNGESKQKTTRKKPKIV